MATKSMSYDHPAYLAPVTSSHTSVAGATTNGARFAAYTAMIAKSVTLYSLVAGTATTHGYTINKLSGTTTTSIGVTTLGTATIGTVTNVTLGSTALAQGDTLLLTSLADATGTVVAAYELLVTPGASVTV